MRTSFLKLNDCENDWFVVDSSNAVLGRLASFIAVRLRGKHLPSYTPFMPCGDKIVVINTSLIRVSGEKYKNKVYYRHTGYPGGLRKTLYCDMFKKDSTKVLYKAVLGMMPKESPLARKQMKNLYIYDKDKHPHLGQKCQSLILKHSVYGTSNGR